FSFQTHFQLIPPHYPPIGNSSLKFIIPSSDFALKAKESFLVVPFKIVEYSKSSMIPGASKIVVLKMVSITTDLGFLTNTSSKYGMPSVSSKNHSARKNFIFCLTN